MATTTAKSSAYSEEAAQELIRLIDARNAIDRDIYDVIQAYTWEYDDDEAARIKRHWLKLESRRDEAARAIKNFMARLKVGAV